LYQENRSNQDGRYSFWLSHRPRKHETNQKIWSRPIAYRQIEWQHPEKHEEQRDKNENKGIDHTSWCHLIIRHLCL
jgi:hypothetical protein